MSYIFNALIQSRIEEFNKVNPVGSGKLDVKPGQIMIKAISTEPIGVNGEATICRANWKPSDNSAFYEGQIFTMYTDVLYNEESKGAKGIQATELVNKMIWVGDPRIAYRIKNKKYNEMYNLKWFIVDKQPQVVTQAEAFSHVFFGNADTLGIANDQLTSTAEFSLLTAFELEAKFGSSMFDQINYTEEALYNNVGDCEDALLYENAGDCLDANLQIGGGDCVDAVM